MARSLVNSDASVVERTAHRLNRAAFAVASVCSVIVMCGTNVVSAAETNPTKEAAVVAKEAADREQKLDDARKRLDEAAREVAELSMALSDDVMPPRVGHIMGRQLSRAMLGVNIGPGRDASRADGVEIVSVSPGGAAADAGLKSGDVLIEIKGTSLKQDKDGTPRDKLLSAMRSIEPEEKVKVRYLRDGKAATATVVPERSDRMVSMPFRRGPGGEDFPSFAFMRSDGSFGSAELVALTPKLGQYFGTDKGLLVVRAPADSRLKLEEGDVIVDIDGRVPTNASHALRILSSYQAGEKLKLNVLRMKKRTTFDIVMPEDVLEHRSDERRLHLHRDVVVPAPAPPLPPAPPAAPAGSDDA